ncbi:MAG: MFS transporter, partial [Verrucomicrobiota bacterium]
ARTFVILGMAGVAFLPGRIDHTTQIALMLFLLFVYNASRGFSVCGFLPWLTQLVPEPLRGRYLSRDQMATAVAMLGTMVATAWWLRGATGTTLFGAVFVVAFLAGMASLVFLRRIPDVPVTAASSSGGPVPWKAMLLHSPFFRLVIYDVVVLVALAGSGVCWVPLLRDVYGFQDWQFLGMMSLWSAGSALALWGFGAVADRVGSKPLLGASGIILVIHLILWGAVAAQVVAPTLWLVVVLQMTAALGLALFSLPNTRLAMAVVPEMGRSHFFALFSVATSLTAGIFPILWGIGIDCVGDWKLRWGAWEWNQYSLCFAGVVVVMVVAQIFRARLLEPKAMPTDVFLHELLVKTPSRALTRLLTRRPLG